MYPATHTRTDHTHTHTHSRTPRTHSRELQGPSTRQHTQSYVSQRDGTERRSLSLSPTAPQTHHTPPPTAGGAHSLAQARADAQAPSAAPRPRVGLRRAASSRSAAPQSQQQQQQFLLRHHRAKQERAARVAIVRASRSEGLPLQSAMTRALRASAAHRRHPAATWSMQCARMYA